MLRLSPCTLLLLSAMVVLFSTKSVAGKSLNPRQGDRPPLFFTTQLEAATVVTEHESTFLECSCAGFPIIPTIHWLKYGNLIQGRPYGDSNDITDPGNKSNKTGVISSRLYLLCPGKEDEGVFTCVADSGVSTQTSSTNLTVESSGAASGESCSQEPAKIYMWTKFRFELENATLRVLCRASGNPEPTITWSKEGTQLPGDSSQYTIESNGDLIISSTTHEGNSSVSKEDYTCTAANSHGSDSQTARLYIMKGAGK